MEVRELFDELVHAGNASHLGAYMYAGHRTGKSPFEVIDDMGVPLAVSYAGDSGVNRVEVGRPYSGDKHHGRAGVYGAKRWREHIQDCAPN